jgi:hypothetical protein
MDHPNLKLARHLIRPVRGAAAGVLVVFAILLVVAWKAGYPGIPLAFVLLSWFFKYAYILFDHTVLGYDEPPGLDIKMLNPVDEQRPLAQLAILGLIYLGVHYANERMGSTVAISIGVVALFFVPASVAVLGLERHFFKAANPVAWVRMVLGLGPMYAAVLAIIAVYALLITLLARLQLWFPLAIATFMFCILSAFSFLAGALYERRHELGLDTAVSPERTRELLKAEELRENQKLVTEAYGQMRAGSHIKAWQQLNTWLTERGSSPEDYRWLCACVAAWGDARYVTRLTQDHVERLLALKQTGEALDVVSRRISVDPSFRPKSAASTLQIARIAAEGGGALRVARTLLADFSARFPHDPLVAAAESFARRIGH